MDPLTQFEHEHVRPKPGRTLIVGSKVYRDKPDRRKAFPDAVGVDMLPGDGVDVVQNLEDEDAPWKLGQFDHIECKSVLEHCRKPWLVAANLQAMMTEGATIFVAVPWIWPYHGYPDDYYRYTPEGIQALFEGVQWLRTGVVREVMKLGHEIPRVKINGYPHFPRTETVAYGIRR